MTVSLGRFGEAYAVGYLARQGYVILERNVRYRVGEIDLIARDGDTLSFVEVKCRRSNQFGSPEMSITERRYQHLACAVSEYLQRHGLEDADHRIDVLSIEVDRGGHVRRCDLIRGAEPPAP